MASSRNHLRMVTGIAVALLFTSGVLLVVRAQPSAQAQGRGVRVSIPTGWTWDEALAADGGPIALKSFTGEYLRGGILPADGADITITADDAPASLSDLANQEAEGATDVRAQEAPVLNSPAMSMSSVDSYTAQLSIATHAYYVLHGSKVYKFYLSHRAGDANAARLESAFQRLVSGAQFTE